MSNVATVPTYDFSNTLQAFRRYSFWGVKGFLVGFLTVYIYSIWPPEDVQTERQYFLNTYFNYYFPFIPKDYRIDFLFAIVIILAFFINFLVDFDLTRFSYKIAKNNFGVFCFNIILVTLWVNRWSYRKLGPVGGKQFMSLWVSALTGYISILGLYKGLPNLYDQEDLLKVAKAASGQKKTLDSDAITYLIGRSMEGMKGNIPGMRTILPFTKQLKTG